MDDLVEAATVEKRRDVAGRAQMAATEPKQLGATGRKNPGKGVRTGCVLANASARRGMHVLIIAAHVFEVVCVREKKNGSIQVGW
jgi:hypothetical protein